jgi:hypothetical protein
MPNRTLMIRQWPRIFPPRDIVLLCFTMLIRKTIAQDVLTTPTQTPATPIAVQEYEAGNPMLVFTPPEEIAQPYPLQWGPVTAHPQVTYEFLYGTGVNTAPGQSQNTIVQTLSPGILLNLGEHWTIDYTPSLVFYSSSGFRNVVNQSVNLGWGTSYGGDWLLTGSQSFTDTSNPSTATAAQTDQQTYITAFAATHQINDRISLNLGFNQDLSYVGNTSSSTNSQISLANSMSWSTLEWLNYEFWPRFNVGLGLGLGYVQPEASIDSIYQQYQGRVNWRATDKISFSLSGGFQDLNYLSGDAGSVETPIYAGTIDYQPVEQTQLSIGSSRVVEQSLYQNQVSDVTSVTVGLTQRLLERLNLNLFGSYGTTEYLASETGLSTSRTDDLYSFTVRLSSPVFTRGTFSVFYTYTDNMSTQSGFTTSASGFSYSSSQMGFEFGYNY